MAAAVEPVEISSQPPPPPNVYPGGLQLKPRVEKSTMRESFAKGRTKHVVLVEKRDNQ
ncbi:hypothetical protein [Nitrobacter sp.]|uniref:hypothetical protein n=1 Tax=Nitrobacter sp. TaxID=29420 RepID=UPI00399D7A12